MAHPALNPLLLRALHAPHSHCCRTSATALRLVRRCTGRPGRDRCGAHATMKQSILASRQRVARGAPKRMTSHEASTCPSHLGHAPEASWWMPSPDRTLLRVSLSWSSNFSLCEVDFQVRGDSNNKSIPVRLISERVHNSLEPVRFVGRFIR